MMFIYKITEVNVLMSLRKYQDVTIAVNDAAPDTPCLVGVSQYIDISVYRNTRIIYIVSQYEIRIAIYRDLSFF